MSMSDSKCVSCGSEEYVYVCNNCKKEFDGSLGLNCPRCGVNVTQRVRECPECGSRYYTRSCPNCGYSNLNNPTKVIHHK